MRLGDAVLYGHGVHLGELGDRPFDDLAVTQAGRGEGLDVAGQLLVDPRTQLARHVAHVRTTSWRMSPSSVIRRASISLLPVSQ
jgi:hypothetical protein